MKDIKNSLSGYKGFKVDKVDNEVSRIEMRDLDGISDTSNVLNITRACSSTDGTRSIWQNPFKLAFEDYNKLEKRMEVLNKYKNRLFKSDHLKSEILNLKGKKLLCNCRRNQLCHGDVIISAYNYYNSLPVETNEGDN